MTKHIVRNTELTFPGRVSQRVAMPLQARGAALLQHLLNPFGGGKAQALLQQFPLGCPPKEHSLSSEMVLSPAIPCCGPRPTLLTLGKSVNFSV